MCVPTNVIWNPQTKKPKTKSTYPLCEKASAIASVNFCSLSTWEELIIDFAGNKNKDTTNPMRINIIKYFKVCSQSNWTRLYFVRIGDKKYPIDAAAVTIPVAIVLVSLGKCFPTSETGTPIAVAPKAVPIKTPRANWK